MTAAASLGVTSGVKDGVELPELSAGVVLGGFKFEVQQDDV